VILPRRERSFPLPEIDGRTVFQVLVMLAGLIGLVILTGSLLYWLLSDSFPDLDQTPWLLVIGTLIQTAVIVGAVEFGWRRRKGLSWQQIGFRPAGRKTILLFLLAGLALAGMVELVERLLEIKPGDLIPALIAPQGFDWLHFLAVLVSVGLIAPVAEEILFRGVLYSWFRKHVGVTLSLLVNGALFGLIHAGYPLELMFLVGLMGVIFALSFEWTGSLWLPIVLHIGQNSAVVIAIFATLYVSP